MTDKQIIIDGVDVSGCDFLATKDDYCSYSGITYAYKGQCMCSDEEMCKEHPNCFYKKNLKKLKRKEQECEELKKKCNIYTCGICGNKEDCNKLYKTIAEIKEIAENVIKNVSDRCIETTPMYYIHKQILQKISEVEDDKITS